ncbi:MAG TPA: biotin--[acetyl-CoA-carboxylase] ligase [Methanothermococcus okinawensis]|uniref:Biotin--[acetyl-CoA-carboxylase] ligase n=1 Tax=Methanothermococcus okinawensis TaxID=155863 RepID=A0A832YUZ2_9EURY|nr:biotin--[acetyl-CoA-carboxylase] ligase [Methanothermococcus okinawensis]
MDFDIIHLREVDSTNKYCRNLGKMGKKNLIVISDVQSSGVGRLERKWHSQYGGLYFSILLGLNEVKNKNKNENMGKLNFIGSISLYESLFDYINNASKSVEDYNIKTFGIKYPNDLIININGNNKKISGILSEVNMDYGFLILGIGININNNISRDLKDIAISLKELTGREHNRFEVFNKFIDRFKNNYHLSDSEILNKYEKYSKTLGNYVKIITPKEVIIGTVFKIDYEGIYLSTFDGIKHVNVGDCIHLR